MRRSEMAGTILLIGVLACRTAPADVTLGPLSEKGPEDVPALIEALNDEEMGRRWNAALLLGQLGDRSAVPALIACVEADDNTRVRRRAMDALAMLDAGEATPALIAALEREDDLERRDAARALGRIGDKSAVPALLETLKDGEGFVRRDAARALGRIGDKSAVPALKALSEETAEQYSSSQPLAPHEESPTARAAVFALMELGGDTFLPAFETLLDNERKHVRLHAINTAASMGRRAAAGAPLITEYLADGELLGVGARAASPSLRRAAIEALQAIGGPEGVAGLSRAFELIGPPWGQMNIDRGDIDSAAQALVELGDPAALPALREALEKYDDEEVIEHSGTRVRMTRIIRNAISELEE